MNDAIYNLKNKQSGRKIFYPNVIFVIKCSIAEQNSERSMQLILKLNSYE